MAEKTWIPILEGKGRSINLASAKWIEPVDESTVLVCWPGDAKPTTYRDEAARMILRCITPRLRSLEDRD